jgi:hypothetical protein
MMRNKIVYITLLLSLGFVFQSFAPEATELSYFGSAFDAKTRKMLYTELHEEHTEKGKHIGTITTYKDASGKVIARRKLDFAKDNNTPTFKLEDLRSGYIEGAEMESNNVKVYVRTNFNAPMEEHTLKVPAPCVIDGGFNYFVKKNWDTLLKGNSLTFNFVVPARQDYYKFRVRKVNETTYMGKKAMVVYLEPDNFIIRALVDPIVITYDLSSKRILVYEGISNLASNTGKNYVARLIYPTVGP